MLELKRAIVAFTEAADSCLASGVSDVSRMNNWLRQERLSDIKREHRRWEERASEARIRLLAAKSMSNNSGRASSGRTSFEDEERDFRRAKAALKQRMKNCAPSTRPFPNYRDSPMAAWRCAVVRNGMSATLPKALAQLEQMIQGLEGYGQHKGAGS